MFLIAHVGRPWFAAFSLGLIAGGVLATLLPMG
jgi:hypothetical protein